MKASIARARLSVLTAALLFGTGGAAIKGTALMPIQVACFRSGVAAVALLLVPAARRGFGRDLAAPALSYAATLVSFVVATKLWALHDEAPSALALCGGSLLVGVLLVRTLRARLARPVPVLTVTTPRCSDRPSSKGRPDFMPHIDVKNPAPGIVGLLHYRAETAAPLSQLAEVLLRGPSTLGSGEREIIASYVSWLNRCHFCHSSHGAAAAAHLKVDLTILDDIKEGTIRAKVSPKLRALLQIAAKVQQGGKSVSADDVASARAEGATDLEIHDTVLIAAAFCMYNRYVDGLATWAPDGSEPYREVGVLLATQGYIAALERA